MTTFSRIAARPLAAAIRRGGNPVARIVNRTADLYAKASTYLMERRYTPGKVRDDISSILNADALTCDWFDPRAILSGPTSIRTDIVRSSLDGQLYVPGKIAKFVDLLQPSLTLPPSLREIVDNALRIHSISPRLRNTIRNEMLCAITNERDPDMNRGLLLNLLALAKSMTKRFESDPRAIRPYAAQLKDIAKGAEVDLGRDNAVIMLTTLSHLVLNFPEGSFADVRAIKRYARTIKNMMTTPSALCLGPVSMKLLTDAFSRGLVESIPEAFANDRGGMDRYWEVLLHNYSDALISKEVRDLLEGTEDPLSETDLPTGQLSDLPKAILKDKKKLDAVLEVAVKYPVKFGLGQLFSFPFFYMVRQLPEGLLADDPRFFRVTGFIKSIIERGEESSGIMLAYNAREAKDMRPEDPAQTIESCIKRLTVSLGIMFRYAGRRIMKGNNFSRFFEFSREDDLSDRIYALAAIESMAKKGASTSTWAKLLEQSDPEWERPLNPLLKAFINILFPDEENT